MVIHVVIREITNQFCSDNLETDFSDGKLKNQSLIRSLISCALTEEKKLNCKNPKNELTNTHKFYEHAYH
jgi:hypothetical protein